MRRGAEGARGRRGSARTIMLRGAESDRAGGHAPDEGPRAELRPARANPQRTGRARQVGAQSVPVAVEGGVVAVAGVGLGLAAAGVSAYGVRKVGGGGAR